MNLLVDNLVNFNYTVNRALDTATVTRRKQIPVTIIDSFDELKKYPNEYKPGAYELYIVQEIDERPF